MIRLLDTRGARHTERMTLEFLVEAFSKQACTELRDRVFALLGLAIDVRPRSKHAEGDSGEGATPDGSGAVPGNQPEIVPESERRGKGSFSIDYSHSFSRIWEDVVKFVFVRPRRTDRWIIAGAESPDREPQNSLLPNERRISIVRTAGVVQEALGQMVEAEVGLLTSVKASLLVLSTHC
jgi:hypothetical protein